MKPSSELARLREIGLSLGIPTDSLDTLETLALIKACVTTCNFEVGDKIKCYDFLEKLERRTLELAEQQALESLGGDTNG